MIDGPASQHGAATTPPTLPFSRPRLEPRLDTLGAYRLYECLGSGGYASVYRARRIGEADPCDLALKRLHPHLMRDDDAVRAFGREAQLAYLLDHPTIRRVYSLARAPGELFMTMEYIDGASVFDLLRRASTICRHLPLSGVLSLLHRLCEALHYAHELVDELGVPAGFVHRDVSPSNLMIAAGGRLKLIDMGAAGTRIEVDAAGSRPLKVRGKYGYMAPEAMRHATFDRRADVFSVGVVAWELLTLCRLYPVSKPPVDIELVRSRPLAAPSTFNRRCPSELDAVVIRALARDPDARWPSCAAMADALTGVAARLRETISDAAIATLAEHVDHPMTRPRLARGTSPPSSVATSGPAPEVERGPATVIAPPSGCRRAVAIGGVGGSLATLLVAGIAHGSFDLPVPAAPAAPPVRAPVTPRAVIAPVASPPPARPSPSAPPRSPPPPPSPPPPAPQSAPPPVRLGGSPPRSWSAAYPYRARLCIDVDGKVLSVAVIDAPSRLDGRIMRALQRWRYAPVAQTTCFEVNANVEKVPGR